MTTKAELLKRVRLNCVECMGGPRYSKNHAGNIQHAEDIDQCTAPECAFYPFRHGKDPWPSKSKVSAGRKLASSSKHRRKPNA